MSNTKSWIITAVPLIVYLISFSLTFVTNTDLSTQQAEMLTGLMYAFLGAGAIGASKSVLNKSVLSKIPKQ